MNAPTNPKVAKTLADYFGFRAFRPYQEEIVEAILARRDVFAVMPTGGGKSLCYQLPALLVPGVCVVVSPLLSLMKDQVDAAQKNGVNAATLNSTTQTPELREIYSALERRALDLLYISPERFNSESFQERLSSYEVGFFAVDEAHCISQWGHNFRADYLELGQIVEKFPQCPVAAFTATATEQVADDIKSLLRLRDPFCVRASFNRPNLFYKIQYKDKVDEQILSFIRTCPDESGIVYRSTRKKVEETARFLQDRGLNAKYYHAGMSDADRARVQEEFANDETPIIVATIAFGMGIDKSNVRFVVHGDLPKDVESYYQETGRAGRDGAPAQCLLVYGQQDFAVHRHFLEDYEDPVAKEAAARRLSEMMKFAETDGCRRANLLKYFGETYAPAPDDAEPDRQGCGGCDFCVGEIERVDATVNAQKALSAMQRTGNRFGVEHLIDVLVGNRAEKVERFGHDELPTFGVGANETRKYWRTLFRQLMAQGAAELNPDSQFPIPRVTSQGWEIMRGRRKVQIVASPNERPRRAASVAATDKNGLVGRDRRLFETLRQLRMAVAKNEGVPPYQVFTDKTLIDMTHLKPTVDGDFLLVSGVGVKKLENYGYEFMRAIEKFLDENPE